MAGGTRKKGKKATKKSLKQAGEVLFTAATNVSGSSSSATSPPPQQQPEEDAESPEIAFLASCTSQVARVDSASLFKEIESNSEISLSVANTDSAADISVNISVLRNDLLSSSTPDILLPSSTIPHCKYFTTNTTMPTILLVVQPRGLANFNTETGMLIPEGRDTWLSEWGMKLNDIVPCLPEGYEVDGLAGKAVYVVGIHSVAEVPEVKRLFSRHGKVEKCPTIIDMVSENTFRFVIMSTAAEADSAVHKLNGSLYKGKTIQVCKALNPNDDLRFPDVYSVDQIFAGQLNPTAEQFQVLTQLSKKEAQEQKVIEPDDKGKGPAISPVPQIAPIQTNSAVHGHPDPVGAPLDPQLNYHSIEPLTRQFTQQSIQSDASQIFVEQVQNTPSATAPVLPQQSSILQGEAEELSLVVPEAASAEFKNDAQSWASIATSSADKSKTIDLNPERKPISAAPRLQPIGRIPPISVSQSSEPMAEQMRVVFILNLPTNITLQDISDAITEGPLVSIRFGVDANNGNRYAGVIFQFARDAETFYQVLRKESIDAKPVRFRFLTDAFRGEAFPTDSVITAMSGPTYASRRLTIVKSRFFFIFGERHLRSLCEKAVGADNVQLIWLYNGGNATVVFAEVAAAMKIKKTLDQMRDDAADKGAASALWEGLTTTYSKDPCIQPLRLESVMHE